MRLFIIAHRAQRGILLKEDVQGVSFGPGGVGPGEYGSTPQDEAQLGGRDAHLGLAPQVEL
jgi:hypothetical protein